MASDSTWLYVLTSVLFITTLYFAVSYYSTPTPLDKDLVCPKIEIPACPQVACNPAIIEKKVYEKCDTDIADDMTKLEEDLGKEVYTFTSSRTCDDFLTNHLDSKWDKRDIQGHESKYGGCKVYYTYK